jgi:16S rRNA (guanine966-N2)-methyltransferase
VPKPVQNKIRIIGGIWRSRIIKIVDSPGLRPTPARVRETLFNWLQADINASRCLDLYAGSGALSFEAVSRGAKLAVQVENNQKAAIALKENVLTLKTEQIKIVQADVLEFLAQKNEAFDLVFIDPPFSLNLVVPCCQLLEDQGWLAKYAKIYVETGVNIQVQDDMPSNWRLLKNKTAGEVRFQLYERVDPDFFSANR